MSTTYDDHRDHRELRARATDFWGRVLTHVPLEELHERLWVEEDMYPFEAWHHAGGRDADDPVAWFDTHLRMDPCRAAQSDAVLLAGFGASAGVGAPVALDRDAVEVLRRERGALVDRLGPEALTSLRAVDAVFHDLVVAGSGRVRPVGASWARDPWGAGQRPIA